MISFTNIMIIIAAAITVTTTNHTNAAGLVQHLTQVGSSRHLSPDACYSLAP